MWIIFRPSLFNNFDRFRFFCARDKNTHNGLDHFHNSPHITGIAFASHICLYKSFNDTQRKFYSFIFLFLFLVVHREEDKGHSFYIGIINIPLDKWFFELLSKCSYWHFRTLFVWVAMKKTKGKHTNSLVYSKASRVHGGNGEENQQRVWYGDLANIQRVNVSRGSLAILWLQAVWAHSVNIAWVHLFRNVSYRILLCTLYEREDL